MTTHKPSREISPAERNRHSNEVPMPEQKTGDAPDTPKELPHLAGRFSREEAPDHPPSEMA